MKTIEASARLTPSVHRQTVLSQTILSKSSDKFVASFGKTGNPVVSDIKTYTTFNEDGLEQFFKTNVSRGILNAMLSYPEKMVSDILEEGYSLSVADSIDKLIVKKSVDPKKFIDPAKARININSAERKKIAKEQLIALRKYYDAFLNKTNHKNPIVLQLSKEIHQSIPEGNDFEVSQDLIFEIGIKQSWIEAAKNFNGPNYFKPMYQTFLPGFIQAKGYDDADIRKKDASYFERIIRHETAHCIDEMIGIKKTGLKFSKDPLFRQLIKKDFERATQEELWPNPDEQVPLFEDAQMVHYFPEQFDNSDKTPAYNEARYTEAFAECLSALTGGGAVDSDRVKSIYKHGCEWVKHNVLMPYERPPFWKNPFKWLKWAVQPKNKYSAVFTKTPASQTNSETGA